MKILLMSALALILLIYVGTNRYSDVVARVQKHGLSQLNQEPEWLLSWIRDELGELLRRSQKNLEKKARKAKGTPRLKTKSFSEKK